MPPKRPKPETGGLARQIMLKVLFSAAPNVSQILSLSPTGHQALRVSSAFVFLGFAAIGFGVFRGFTGEGAPGAEAPAEKPRHQERLGKKGKMHKPCRCPDQTLHTKDPQQDPDDPTNLVKSCQRCSSTAGALGSRRGRPQEAWICGFASDAGPVQGCAS